MMLPTEGRHTIRQELLHWGISIRPFWLAFHQATYTETGKPAYQTTQWMVDNYPADLDRDVSGGRISVRRVEDITEALWGTRSTAQPEATRSIGSSLIAE